MESWLGKARLTPKNEKMKVVLIMNIKAKFCGDIVASKLAIKYLAVIIEAILSRRKHLARRIYVSKDIKYHRGTNVTKCLRVETQ